MPSLTSIAVVAGLAGLAPGLQILLCVAIVLGILWILRRKPSERRAPNVPAQAPLVIVINLDRNEARLQKFVDRYEETDLGQLPLHRMSAVDGSSVEWSQYLSSEALEALVTVQKSGFRKTHPELTPGAVGCYLSHLQAWTAIASSGRPFGLVFEDDAAPPRNTMSKLYTALNSAPPDWDIILLGYAGYGQLVSPVLTELDSFLLFHAYAISADTARRLCATMLPITRQIDWEVSDRIKSEGLKVYGLNPSLVKQDWQGTDIQLPLQASSNKKRKRPPADLHISQPLEQAIDK